MRAAQSYRAVKTAEARIAAHQAQIRQIQDSLAEHISIYTDFVAAIPAGQQMLDAQLAVFEQFGDQIGLPDKAPAAPRPRPAAPQAPAAPAQRPAAPAAPRAAAPVAPARTAPAAAPAPAPAPAPAAAPARAPTPRPAVARAPAPATPPAAAPAKAAPKPAATDASGAQSRTAAATQAAAEARRLKREANPGHKEVRSIPSRMMLFDEGFMRGFREYAEDQTAQNPYSKGDRSRGWAKGAEKAAEDIAAGIIPPGVTATAPAIPAPDREAYEAELIAKSPNAARTVENGSRPHKPAGSPAPAGAPILASYDVASLSTDEINQHFADHEPPDSEPAAHLEHYDETAQDSDMRFAVGTETPIADPTAFLTDNGGSDDDIPDFLRN